MKELAIRFFLYLFYNFVPYMRLGRKTFHLFLLKKYSKYVGKNFNFHYGVLFLGTKQTTFGDNISIGRHSLLSMGNTVSIIGNNVMMGSDVKLLTISHGYQEKNTPMQQQKSTYSPIVIEDNVWIGDGVKIISGNNPIHIASGIIIGAGSVVTKSLQQENGIYVGVPAKFLKSRFS